MLYTHLYSYIIILLFYCSYSHALCINCTWFDPVSNEASETLQVPWVATLYVCVSMPAFYWLGDRKQEVYLDDVVLVMALPGDRESWE